MTPKIICARCAHQVEWVTWWDDFSSANRVIEANCHGEKDRMVFDPGSLSREQLSRLQRSVGIAFKPRAAIATGGKG